MADDVRGGECVNLSGEGMCQECINGSHNSPVRFVARRGLPLEREGTLRLPLPPAAAGEA